MIDKTFSVGEREARGVDWRRRFPFELVLVVTLYRRSFQWVITTGQGTAVIYDWVFPIRDTRWGAAATRGGHWMVSVH